MAKKPNRSSSAVVFVRMTDAERETMERAIAKLLTAAEIPDAKLTIGKFLLHAGLERSREVLGRR